MTAAQIFKVPAFPPGVEPEDSTMAMDASFSDVSSWAVSQLSSAFSEGQGFLGYPYLVELAQRPEYRRAVEIMAWEMTRKWIKFTAKGDDDKSDKIAKLEAEFERLKVKHHFRRSAEIDGFFGRSHIYMDFGNDDRDELTKPIGNGSSKASRVKIGKGSLKGLKVIEAMWSYPMDYNANDPISDNWYKPQSWQIMSRQIDASRILTFVGRPVPDMLKPAYAFGGLSITQMMKPYVDIWLQTRQSVADLIRMFSIVVLMTDMSGNNGAVDQSFFDRIDFFNRMRSNSSTMVVNKESEDLKNVSAPLGGLDGLQQQALEHICVVNGLPLVKYTGITPSGLNASSEGELRVFYDYVLAAQINLFGEPLDRLLPIIQLSLFGQVDEDIGYEFISLWEMTEIEKADIRLKDAQAGQLLIDDGAIAPEEERRRVVEDEYSPYQGLDPEDMPEASETEEQVLSVAGRPVDAEADGGDALDHLPWGERHAGDEFDRDAAYRAAAE